MDGEEHFSIKAILLGWLVDTGTSFLFSIILGLIIYFFYQFTAANSADAGTIEARLDNLYYTFPFMVFEMSFGLIFTMVGGFVTAYIAKESIIKHTFAMGCLSLATSLLMMVYLAEHSFPLWYWIAAGVLPVPAAVLGGYVYTIVKEDFRK